VAKIARYSPQLEIKNGIRVVGKKYRKNQEQLKRREPVTSIKKVNQ